MFFHDLFDTCFSCLVDTYFHYLLFKLFVTFFYVFICLLTAASRFVGLSLVRNLFLGVELSLVQNLFLKHDPFRDRRSRGGAAECVS